jgi:hypothetical protein
MKEQIINPHGLTYSFPEVTSYIQTNFNREFVNCLKG